jgi:hypothetical protein
MGELLHELDLLQRLLHLEGVHFDLLQSETLIRLVPRQIHAPETALPDHLHCLVGLHDMIIRSSKLERGKGGRERREGGSKEGRDGVCLLDEQ